MKTIIISDVASMVSASLDGDRLTIISSGGTPADEILGSLYLDENWNNREIRGAVYDRWIVGYDGDPTEARLEVSVE